MKRFLLPAAAVAVLISMVSMAADTYLLAVKYESGQLLRYKLNAVVDMTIQDPDKSTHLKISVLGTMAGKVQDVASDGSAQISAAPEEAAAEIWVDDQHVTIGPDQIKTILKDPIRVRVTPAGLVIPVPQDLSGGAGPGEITLGPFLPREPVPVGQEWSEEQKLPGSGGYTAKNRLAGVEQAGGALIARIEQDMTVDLPAPTPAGAAVDGQVTVAGSVRSVGTMLLDLNTGRIQQLAELIHGNLNLGTMAEGTVHEAAVAVEGSLVMTLLE